MIYDKYLMLPLEDLPHYEGLAPPKWGHRLPIRFSDGENPWLHKCHNDILGSTWVKYGEMGFALISTWINQNWVHSLSPNLQLTTTWPFQPPSRP